MSGAAGTGIPLFERLIVESQSLCNRSCWFCPRTFDTSGKYLAPDGNTHGAFGLGNIHDQGLADIWHSERHVRIVNDLLNARRDDYALCRHCPMSPTGKAVAGGRIRMKHRSGAGPLK